MTRSRTSPPSAIVTGAAGGIGSAIVRRLSDDGYHVIATDLVAALERSQLGEVANVTMAAADLREHSSYQQLIDVAVTRCGGVDLIVNNAVVSRYESFLEITPDSWDEILSVGLTSYFFLTQAAAQHMVASGYHGAVVNVASVNSFAAEPGTTHYAVVKGGVAQMTRALCVELGSHGIRVNAVAPGPIRTPALAEIQDSPEFAATRARIPAGRIGKPEEIAVAVAFLGSDQASYITGSILLADGGLLSVI